MPSKLARPAPPYRQIADEIRARISSGELQAGDLVPSVRSLMREYSVAIATAQRALSTLRNEGYLKSKRGVGSIVTTQEERASILGDKSSGAGKVSPAGQYTKVGEAAIGEASERVAAALGLAPGAPIVQRMRMSYRADGKPVSMATSYFRGDLAARAPLLLSVESIAEGAFTYVANTTKCTVGAWQDQFEPGIATAAQAEQLGLGEGALIMASCRWIYDSRGEVLEYCESFGVERVIFEGAGVQQALVLKHC
ncbi:GntR family transcriptional regulator [Kribbella sp. NPDC051770]|uniref:GntR family transcriptional regulator n=1 Tax=Kribbella sp. NPDC051770 TaxID=3155413 RepID=UPI003448DDB6